MEPLGVTVNAIAPGVFRPALNAELLDKSERGKELLLHTPMGALEKPKSSLGPPSSSPATPPRS